MSYTHRGLGPIRLINDPIDADSTDWFYFAYGDWLPDGVTITADAATVTGCDLLMDSTYFATRTDSSGITYTEVYGVQVGNITATDEIRIQHRIATSAGQADLDRTIIVPVVAQ